MGSAVRPPREAGEWWRVLTAAFVHAGCWHVFVNMLCLLYFGRLVERMVGPAVFVVCYVMTGITVREVCDATEGDRAPVSLHNDQLSSNGYRSISV